MTEIFKYQYHGTPGLILGAAVPKGAKLLSGKMQHGTPTYWFMVDPTEGEMEVWNLCVMFTGQYMPIEAESYTFCGTDIEGSLVYHFFAQRQD